MPDGLAAFAAPGRFHRGNVHTHSSRSDGRRTPEEVCAFYREAGYDFLCLSDHFLERYGFPVTDTRGERRDGFTTLLGAEVHAPANSHGEIWHILAVGLPVDFAPTAEGETGEALAARARAAGAFVGIAHPQWSSLTIEDGRAMSAHAHAVEIFNTSCAVETGRADGTALLDALVSEGHRHLSAIATDDAHFTCDDAGHAWTMVKATSNEPEALLAAMKAGHVYASTGPELHCVARDGDEILVECAAARTVALVGRGSRSVYRVADGERPITALRLPLERFAGDWCRVVVIDRAGRAAWTGPVYPD